MTLANAAYLGIERFASARNKENWANATENDKQALIRAVYRQVLGNQYVMASERLEGPESLFKRGYLSVREFVRQVAKSGLYKAKFFENCNAYRFIELNFKHLLGRAPQNKAEMLHHFTILQEQGYDAEIDSYLDSAEYQERFGEEMVPYVHAFGYSVGQQGLQFSYVMQLGPWRRRLGSRRCTTHPVTPQPRRTRRTAPAGGEPQRQGQCLPGRTRRWRHPPGGGGRRRGPHLPGRGDGLQQLPPAQAQQPGAVRALRPAAQGATTGAAPGQPHRQPHPGQLSAPRFPTPFRPVP